MPETAYIHPAPSGAELAHRYGSRLHLLSDAWALSILARLGSPETDTLTFHHMLEAAYRRLVHAFCGTLPTLQARIPTRMAELTPKGNYVGAILDPNHQVVVVDVARAGILPSIVCQRALMEVLNPSTVRVDHLYMQRTTDGDGRVTGVSLDGSKIGGPVDGATILVPDPMGATGGTVIRVIEHYRKALKGKPANIVACHLMVTPEYLRRMAEEAPEVDVFAMRVDRGMSDDTVLAQALGAAGERGLTDTQYIVPGAGGLGEIVNNSFV